LFVLPNNTPDENSSEDDSPDASVINADLGEEGSELDVESSPPGLDSEEDDTTLGYQKAPGLEYLDAPDAVENMTDFLNNPGK
jgi:hypothetical protein